MKFINEKEKKTRMFYEFDVFTLGGNIHAWFVCCLEKIDADKLPKGNKNQSDMTPSRYSLKGR